MTYREIMDIIEDKFGISEFAYHDFGIPGKTSGHVFVDEIGECIEVEQEGGEDRGSNWYSIKYFPDHDVYIKVAGYYTSYEGTDFYGGFEECCSEVRPKEKTIIVYE